jgi:hypothetical protein
MTPTDVASDLARIARDATGTGDAGTLKGDAESLVRLKATLAALAHLHSILVRLRPRRAP